MFWFKGLKNRGANAKGRKITSSLMPRNWQHLEHVKQQQQATRDQRW